MTSTQSDTGHVADKLVGCLLGTAVGDSLGLPVFWPGLLPRNTLFTATVLYHALRRLLPPY